MIDVCFNSNEEHRLKYFKELLIPKFGYINNPDSHFKIDFYFSKNLIKLNFNKIELKNIPTPVTVKKLFSIFEQLNGLIQINLKEVVYFPFKLEIKNIRTSIYLTEIHNQIILNLCINPKGVDKNFLYKKIWPTDKDISINKLDTHLSNLKKLLENKFDRQFNISSNKGKVLLSN